MYKIDINYTYSAAYELPIKEGLLQYKIQVKPRNEDILQNTAHITIIKEEIQSNLQDNLYEHIDSFGNRVLMLRVPGHISEIKISYKATLLVPFYEFPERLIIQNQPAEIPIRKDPDLYLFLQPTQLADLVSYPSDWDIVQGESIYDYSRRLNAIIYQFLEYKSGITGVQTRASDLIQLRKGVCQDYAHLMLSVLRKNNIACRYVSGYLSQGQNMTGDSNMHAWVELYIDAIGLWLGMDPTNDLLADHHYVKVAHGQDYNDCASIKGVVVTPGTHKSVQTVQVAQQQQ